jgi:hypothetical protein
MDRYTKVVLTVIALALVIIASQNSGVLPAYAQSAGLMNIRICGSPMPGQEGVDPYYCAHVNQNGVLYVTR